MHMPPEAASSNILEPRDAASIVWQRLNPGQWPLRLEVLPDGTALVGGAVRDALLDRLPSCPDLDLVVTGKALALTQQLAASLGGTAVVLDERRDIGRLVLRGWTIDIARQEGQSLLEDLRRRDYRLNAMALPLHPGGELVDPTGGLRDLREGRLVAVSEDNLKDDPLRLLRGLRLMAEMRLALDPQTQIWIRCHRNLLGQSAPERILAELERLVRAPHADGVLPLLEELELLTTWSDPAGQQRPIPGINESEGMTPDERDRALPLSRLMHMLGDLGLEQLRASRQLRQRCRTLRRWVRDLPADPETLDETSRYRLHCELEQDLPALILHLSSSQRMTWMQRWRDPDDPLFHPVAAVDGLTLQRELGIKPGPAVGLLLQHLKRERAFLRIGNRASSLKEAQRWCESHSDLL
ncbi:CCA tRNA nucleotidyltransferase [Synechococcus sp. CC9616]|uniref:CCA tRNA nucleotidyltransferase n=1 Tax=Synechococcus sp. CC9616 TaxID=110663 RepID=UPI00351039A9